MTDIEARAERVRQIAESLYGSVLDRDGDTLWCEVPADLCGGFTTLCGMGGFVAINRGQTTRPAFQRVVTTQGDTVVCTDQPMITMAFYRYSVELQTHHVAVTHDPHAGAGGITKQTKATPS